MKNKTVNLSDDVYHVLKNKILRGEYRPGTALKEEILSDTLQVSRTPLRKALTLLMSEGYLVKSKDRTMRIPTVSLEGMKNTMAARKLLEVAAVKEACARATAEDHIRLKSYIIEEKIAQKNRDTLLASSLFLALSETPAGIKGARGEHNVIYEAMVSGSCALSGEAMLSHLDNVEVRILANSKIAKDVPPENELILNQA